MRIPFDIVGCSWPRPVEQVDGSWTSQPEWGTPLMSTRPVPYWKTIEGEPCWTIDWREFFKTGAKAYDESLGGEMRGFHVVFHLRIKEGGKLAFWADDGCVIWRHGEVIHSDRSAHVPTRGEIDVARGDWLQVAQWQSGGEWLWGARPLPGSVQEEAQTLAPADLPRSYLGAVQERLRHPDGPPLKMYLSGGQPVRTIVALYSMVLNGYTPARVVLFGEHQWSREVRKLFATAFPFAEVVPTEQLLKHFAKLGGSRLSEMAQQDFFVMKPLIALVCPPEETCMMDDDVFILDRVDDALEAFERCDLVYNNDIEWGEAYLENWGSLIHGELRSLPTGTFNGGLFWIRHFLDPQSVADYALSLPPDKITLWGEPASRQDWLWDQGLIATLYGRRNTHQLPAQRYFYPTLDGLPGGLVGYDYARNPCGFVSIHYGVLPEKPLDPIAFWLAPQILGRKPEQRICPYRREPGGTAPVQEAR
jgi:hypothetical protein